MTAAGVLLQAAAAGFEVALKDDGSPVLKGPPGERPNAALLAALKEHRAGIITLLGGGRVATTCEPCGALVYGAWDDPTFCDRKRCPMRAQVRRQG